ncbi:protein lin-37 homolog [Uloborus diversus]|uniref:protein lin-37 homolog n=1 Tax=Uloborus diversus TaxID=327109 RepID=UPI0024098ECE|nr:protein lin-37 homolog [Uloborus diversus]
MAFKIKQEKTAPELENARSKLEEALQFIVEKTDESPSTSGDESNKCLDVIIKKEPSPVSSPAKKPATRTQRKRRRRDDTLNKNTNSYIMKLFDRAVDLTPFNEQTPLYPICRAWINNRSLFSDIPETKVEPVVDNPENVEETDKASEEDSTEVRHLPPPFPVANFGRDLKIPSPIPQPDEEFTICSDEQAIVPRELLLENHLQRWKAVRRKWKSYRVNEDRFIESGIILREMFEKSQERDELPANDSWDALNPTN